jgi:hypothetical protein
MGSDYFSLVNPWYHAPVIPLETGYHLYSYSLDFFAIDPMGSTNYGKLTNVSIVPQGSTDAVSSQQSLSVAAGGVFSGQTNLLPVAPLQGSVTPGYGAKYCFITTAVNNNIIRISGGALGKIFSKIQMPRTGRCGKGYRITLTEKHCKFYSYVCA